MKLLSVLLIVPFLILTVFCIPQKKTLKFSFTHEFTLLQLTDMHYGEDELSDDFNTQIIEGLLSDVKPDLTVLSGDMLTGEGHKYNPEIENFFEHHWQKWTQPFQDYNTYYAYLIGNHDEAADLDRREIMELDITHPYSLSQISDPSLPGASTYFLDIQSSLIPNKTAARIWIFDSGWEGCKGYNIGYGCIEPELIEWYETETKKFKEVQGDEALHLAFFHIPIPEYVYLADNFAINGKKENDVNCPIINSGFFEAAKRNGDIKAMFCGHDHLNDYSGSLDGIELVYGRKSGYASAGPSGNIEVSRGGRVIKMKEHLKDGKLYVSFEHYVVGEDGAIDLAAPKAYANLDDKQFVCGTGFIFLIRYRYLIFGISFLILAIVLGREVLGFNRTKKKNEQIKQSFLLEYRSFKNIETSSNT